MSFVVPKKALHFTGQRPALGMPRGNGPRGRDLYRGAEITNDSKPMQPVAAPAPPPPPPRRQPTLPPSARAASLPPPPAPSVRPRMPAPMPMPGAHDPLLDSDEMPTLAARVEDWPMGYAQLGATREGAPLAAPPLPIPNFRAHPYPTHGDPLSATVLTRPPRTLPGSIGVWIVAGLLLGLLTCCGVWAALGPKQKVSAR